jgi:DNA helicase-2/ATP-dependent DNA helicase PcrA
MTREPIITEAEERAYLRAVKGKIEAERDRISSVVDTQARDMREFKKYMSESKSDMDHIEKVAVRQTVDQMGAIGDHSALGLQRLQKLVKSCYFGRVDFQAQGTEREKPVYIGMHSFYDAEQERHLVHDWRAPISSMFYDFETGEASYEAPAGKVGGEIVRKRQYRIEDGELVFMLESSLNIHDAVLQEELSRASSEKMKNIVATIQRDQNAIIRNDVSQVLIIQGAAGSGKTSIALHRIAFLLYRFKETISSDDILIISPNKVFAHYISNVLPELGEENIGETTMEALASRLLGPEIQFQTFYEQVAALFEPGNQAFRDRIQFKASLPFLAQLDDYILHVKNTNLRAVSVKVGRHRILPEFVEQRFHRLGNLPFAARINDIVQSVVDELHRRHSYEIKPKERESVRKQLKAMFGNLSIDALYQAFYEWLEEPAMFKLARRSVYEYSDVFPLLYFRMQLEGRQPFAEVKHLVVDEMQDYTPVQYTVLAQLFPCKKTILGDANQSVNPLSSSNATSINAILSGAECVYMNRSYRSTIQISNLAQRINRNEHLIPIEREGEEPALVPCGSRTEELDRIHEILAEFLASDYKSLGIVCKTQADADAVFEHVRDLSDSIFLIDPTSSAFHEGVTISTAHLAKGLEFDEVILPFCDDKTYHSIIDRHMLYVGCTRAMHKLSLTYTGRLTSFLAD